MRGTASSRRLRVVACGSQKTCSTVPRLDGLAVAHHDDLVGDLAHDGEVVGDEDQAGAGLAADLGEQVEDLRLHGDVERGGRLVGDDRSGSMLSAMAIMMRWRMPPENWCG